MESLQFAVHVTIANISRQEVSLFFEQRKMRSQRCLNHSKIWSRANLILSISVPSLQICPSPKTVFDLMNNESRKKQVWHIVGNYCRREFVLDIVDDPVGRM